MPKLKFKSFTELPRWFKKICRKGNIEKIEAGVKRLMTMGWTETDLNKVALRDMRFEDKKPN